MAAMYFKGVVSHLFLGIAVFEFLGILVVHGQPMLDLCCKEANYLIANDVKVLQTDLGPGSKLVEKLIIDPFFQILFESFINQNIRILLICTPAT